MLPSSTNEAPVQPLAPENSVTAIQTRVKNKRSSVRQNFKRPQRRDRGYIRAVGIAQAKPAPIHQGNGCRHNTGNRTRCANHNRYFTPMGEKRCDSPHNRSGTCQ